VSHERALEIVSGATVAVFTGMREEGGLALAEAMLVGTPVVVLANGGAASIARAATDPECVSLVDPGSLSDTVAAMAEAIDSQTRRSQLVPREDRIPLIDQRAAVDQLETLVDRAVTEGT
jgi:glycosyltransferase involved in cell wall biosynthesis